MARTPTVPPISQPLVDRDGRLTQPWYKFLTGEREYSTNVNTGVNRARAEADAAQTTATSAAQTAQDTQTNAFTVTISAPALVTFSETLELLTSETVTVTPSGGTAPYGYAWAKVSGDTLTVGAASAATTSFSGTPEFNSSLSAVYRCTVTDNVAATASVTVAITLSHISITG